jgi:hypothetical protein
MAYGESRAGSVVYVVSNDEGWHKIGVTADMDLRLYHLSRDIGFKPVSLVYTLAADGASSKVENLAHWALIDHEHQHEWFKVDAATAIEVVNDAARRHGAGERIEKKFAVHRRFAIIDDINDRIPAVLEPGESRHRFIEAAVLAAVTERELKRRGG